MRVLILDRCAGNSYALGLAAGLRSVGVEAIVGGPAAFDGGDVRPVYPRYWVRGCRLAKAMDLPGALTSLARVVRELPPDVVHFQWHGALDVLYARAFRGVCRSKLVFTAHNPLPRSQEDLPGVRRQSVMLELADAVFTHGPGLRQRLCEAHPQIAARVHAIEYGNYEHVARPIPRASARRRLGLPEDGPVFAFIGQVRPRKGLETLLEAYAAHARSGRPGRLLVAGTASDPAYLDSLRELGADCPERPVWLVSFDYVPQACLDSAVSAATQVVLPFNDASQSGTVILAMTHGRCVVTTPVGEVERTVSGRGILVPPASPYALAEALALAADDPGLCDALGRAAREYALRELAWPRIAADTLAVYRGLR